MSDNAPQSRKSGMGALLILLYIGIPLVIAFATAKPSTPSAPNPSHDKISAWVTCQMAVERSLVAPATAKFGRYEPHPENEDKDTDYWFRSYVDAQNAFGANVRTRFNCKVRYDGNDEYTIERLTFD